MISEFAGPLVREWMLNVGVVLARRGITPNVLTVAGLLLNVVVAVVIGTGQIAVGGVLLLVASAFDMLDGAVARADGQETPFGGFLDSTLDRYSEIAIFLGLLLYLLHTRDAALGSVLVFLSVSGSLMVSYARARAEAQGFKASGGLLPRPERVVLLALSLIVGHPIWALWLLATLTHATAIVRIWQVWKATEHAASQTARVSVSNGANHP